MSTLMMVDVGHGDETKSQAVTRRVREELGRLHIPVYRVGELLGIKQQFLSKRMTGKVEWTVDLLGRFCEAAGISYEYVTTGIRELPPEPPAAPHDRPQQPEMRVVGALEPRLRIVKDAVAAEADDDAMAYLRLANVLPRVDSNHQPFGQHPMRLVPVEHLSYGAGRSRMDIVISDVKISA